MLGEIATQIGALGNIEFRPDVGWYAYDNIAAGPHAVTQAGGVTYSYDPNGNMTGSAFADTQAAIRSVEWSSFDKPTRIADALGLAASEFVYGPSRARVKHTVFDGAAVDKSITYIGADFERRAPASGPVALVHFIRAGGSVVAEVTTVDDGNPATDRIRYLHRDHLGSVALVTDEAGAVAEERAFGPWGQARNTDWSVPAEPPALLETPRGFTGHEHLDAVGLIHMNGRVYDPKIGRFMSPDPSDALDPGVGFNRYAYVKNNPVSFTDPSGFIIESAWDAFNVGLGIATAVGNIAAGNYLDAAIDIAGVVGDVAATAVPGVPGGFSSGIKAARAAKYAEKVVDKVVDATKAGKGPVDEVAETAAGKVDDAADAAAGAADDVAGAPTRSVEISRSRHPEAAQHVDEAQAAGHPSELTIDRTGAPSRRKDALDGVPTQRGLDRDEYPPAMFSEGGTGSSVKHINRSDNRGAGACVGRACSDLPDGSKVELEVVD